MNDQEAPDAEEGDMEMEPEAEEAEEVEDEMEMPMETTEETVEESTEEAIEEAVSLKAVKADHADHTDNKTSPVAADGGKKEKLADAHPAKTDEEKSAPAPKAQDLGGTTEPDLKKV